MPKTPDNSLWKECPNCNAIWSDIDLETYHRVLKDEAPNFECPTCTETCKPYAGEFDLGKINAKLQALQKAQTRFWDQLRDLELLLGNTSLDGSADYEEFDITQLVQKARDTGADDTGSAEDED